MNCVFVWHVVTPLAILFSGLLGAFIAIRSIASAREIARKKAAIDFLVATSENKLFKEAYDTIRKLHASEKREIENYVYEKGEADNHLDTRENIIYILNYHENLSVAIRQNIYDEQTIKESRYTAIVRTWRMTRRFVYKIREVYEVDTMYMEFEDLAESWKENPLRPRTPIAVRKKRWWRFYQSD